MGCFKHEVLNTVDFMINKTKEDTNYMSIDELYRLLDIVKSLSELGVREQASKKYVFFTNEEQAINAECCGMYFPLEINCLILEKQGDKDGSKRNGYVSTRLNVEYLNQFNRKG